MLITWFAFCFTLIVVANVAMTIIGVGFALFLFVLAIFAVSAYITGEMMTV
jgi:hypothetical protein